MNRTLNINKIKEIHVFGTSFTAGGGFLWETPEEIVKHHPSIRDRIDGLNRVYDEEPKTMFHYSWPGQLQALFKKYQLNGIKVFNHAKEGFGNETMYRITNDLLWDGNTRIDSDGKIFIYEFSGLGRKEIWFNLIEDYCVLNYGDMTKDLDRNEFVGIHQQHRVNSAGVHLTSDKDIWKKIDSHAKTHLNETINLKEQLKLLERNNHMFIDSLLHHKINFYMVSPPEYPLDKIKNRCIKFGNTIDFVQWGLDHGGLRIQDNVGGKDSHFNLEGNKMIAQMVYEGIEDLDV